mmetsp:Transcript_11516/g.26786  ORF Transcript_11516/g.26786 Transcript_11516/m.26786 type:complete len:256 (-) Transcript_11516:719-1486(-)
MRSSRLCGATPNTFGRPECQWNLLSWGTQRAGAGCVACARNDQHVPLHRNGPRGPCVQHATPRCYRLPQRLRHGPARSPPSARSQARQRAAGSSWSPRTRHERGPHAPQRNAQGEPYDTAAVHLVSGRQSGCSHYLSPRQLRPGVLGFGRPRSPLQWGRCVRSSGVGCAGPGQHLATPSPLCPPNIGDGSRCGAASTAPGHGLPQHLCAPHRPGGVPNRAPRVRAVDRAAQGGESLERGGATCSGDCGGAASRGV